MRIFCWISILVLLFALGCGSKNSKPRFTEEEMENIPLVEKENLPEASGGFVLSVAGETLTSDEVVVPLVESYKELAQARTLEQFKTQAQQGVKVSVINKIANILLYKKAKKELGDQADDMLEKAVKTETRKFIVSFNGDYSKAEEELKKMGMDWVEFRQYQEKIILSQSYLAKQLPDNEKPIMHSELKEYYQKNKENFAIKGLVRYRLIDIDINKLQLADPNQDRSEQGKKFADEIITKVKAGGNFAQLAKEYSNGPWAYKGGLREQEKIESLRPPYDVLIKMVDQLKPGQVTEPVTKGGHIFILKLEEKITPSVEPFEKVQKKLEAMIMFDRQKEAINKLNDKIVEQAKLTDLDRFIDFCLNRIYLQNSM